MQRLLVVFASLVLIGCGRREEAEPKTPMRSGPIPLAEAFVNEVIPVADGGAYIVTLNAGLWYMRGGEAVRVTFPDDEVDRLVLEIVPTVNGGAYAIARPSIWYLQEAKAHRVTESKTISTQRYDPTIEDRFFGLYIAELRKRRAVESDDDASSPVEDDELEPEQ